MIAMEQSTRGGSVAMLDPQRFDRVEGDSLLYLIGHIAARIIAPTTIPSPASGRRFFSEHMILVAICWAYSNKIYLTAEIEELVRHDPRFGHWHAWEPPDASGLQNFRRAHRLSIDCCLYETFLALSGIRNESCSSAEFCEGIAHSKFQKEYEIWNQVQERIESAIETDHLSLED